MSDRTRRHFIPQQEAGIVRRHLAGKEAISALGEEFKVQPSQIHGWVNQVLTVRPGRGPEQLGGLPTPRTREYLNGTGVHRCSTRACESSYAVCAVVPGQPCLLAALPPANRYAPPNHHVLLTCHAREDAWRLRIGRQTGCR
jgi:transposase-like protein